MNSLIIRSWGQWKKRIEASTVLNELVVQDINFLNRKISWDELNLEDTTFIGCRFNREQTGILIEKGAIVYPNFKKLPYNPNRQSLYTYDELLEGYSSKNDQSIDLRIYKHFSKYKYNPPLNEAMAQRIHDFNIDEALRKLVQYDKDGMTKARAVGFMGGHSTRRGTEFYVKTAEAAKLLAEKGYLIVSGGGPGIMEAANLGGYMAGRTHDELLDAIEILSTLSIALDQPEYLDTKYITNAQEVVAKYPEGKENLAIPTWFYGHEPTNLFATHIAKYFSNSIREDTLLAISLYGVVYAPGSAGTTQEIFQEAAQNHYGTFGYYSPMVFLGKKRYTEDTALYSVVHQLARGAVYKDLLYLTDDPQLVANFIENNKPIKRI